LIPALVRPGIAPAAFNSGLTQPLFTELANLLQKRAVRHRPDAGAIPEPRIPNNRISNFARFS
jgi:hypothetical protein